MTDTVLAALIGVGGATLVAVVSVVAQVFTTRWVIRAEHSRTLGQIAAESLARREESRHDRLVEQISRLLAASDPDPEPDYPTAVRLIGKAQLLLDARPGTLEGRLAAALSDLGFKVQAYVNLPPGANPRVEKRDLLLAHAQVSNLARAVLIPRVEEPEAGPPQLPPATD